jgi:hypothetical protein
MKHVTVFGTSHRLQGAELYNSNVHDPLYSVAINRLLDRKDAVFEEASDCGPTTLEKLALDKLGSGHYWDVDRQHGCGITGRSEPIDPNGPPTYTLNYEYDSPQEKREDLWLRRIGEQEFERALFVCGYLHVLSMSFKLRGAGYDIESCYYLPHAKLCDKQPPG